MLIIRLPCAGLGLGALLNSFLILWTTGQRLSQLLKVILWPVRERDTGIKTLLLASPTSSVVKGLYSYMWLEGAGL